MGTVMSQRERSEISRDSVTKVSDFIGFKTAIQSSCFTKNEGGAFLKLDY